MNDFVAEVDVPIPALSTIQSWLPRLNVGDSKNQTTLALQVRQEHILKVSYGMALTPAPLGYY